VADGKLPKTAERGYDKQHKAMRKAHLAQLRDGDPCRCRDTGDRGSGCPCNPIAQPMQHKAELNIDGRSVQLDHLVPLAVGGRRGRVSRFEDYRSTLACCDSERGDGTRGPNSETRSRTRARRGDRDGSPLEPASTTAGTTALSPISDATMPADLPRFPDQNPWPSFQWCDRGVPKNRRHPHATPAAPVRDPLPAQGQHREQDQDGKWS
jgi:hypothetical protein